MNELIRPALTPEQWQRVGVDKPFDLGEVYVDLVDGRFLVDGEGERHGIAAVALRGQPFGFTWHDVDSVMDLAHESGRLEAPTWALPLATRIAALLQPRPEKRWSFEREWAAQEDS